MLRVSGREPSVSNERASKSIETINILINISQSACIHYTPVANISIAIIIVSCEYDVSHNCPSNHPHYTTPYTTEFNMGNWRDMNFPNGPKITSQKSVIWIFIEFEMSEVKASQCRSKCLSRIWTRDRTFSFLLNATEIEEWIHWVCLSGWYTPIHGSVCHHFVCYGLWTRNKKRTRMQSVEEAKWMEIPLPPGPVLLDDGKRTLLHFCLR